MARCRLKMMNIPQITRRWTSSSIMQNTRSISRGQVILCRAWQRTKHVTPTRTHGSRITLATTSEPNNASSLLSPSSHSLEPPTHGAPRYSDVRIASPRPSIFHLFHCLSAALPPQSRYPSRSRIFHHLFPHRLVLPCTSSASAESHFYSFPLHLLLFISV
ncbi:hypothetical protein C8R45DRAFT_1184437 [Mycena sanguinolenta]|nr:hypothetical protein C8R45DRAFT_1184437 [Mycena sanguinolenta]